MKAASWFISAVATAVIPFSLTTYADTLAVIPNEQCTNIICHFYGFANAAVGFSFIPTTNIVVMQVGFTASGNSNPIVSFFAETNLIASYSLTPNPGTNFTDLAIYSPIPPLCLAQGQPYSILLQDGALSNTHLSVQAWENRQISSAISNYSAQFLQHDGTWTNIGSGGFVMGANFYYIVPPCNLSVMIVNTNVWLTFSTYSNELYDVQTRDDLISDSWSDIATNLSGTCEVLRYFDVDAMSATSRFYRVRTHF